MQDAVLIQDLDGPVSVTNDAEAVVKYLHDDGKLDPDTMLLYIDSRGECDELGHDGKGNFTGFHFGVPPKRGIVL